MGSIPVAGAILKIMPFLLEKVQFCVIISLDILTSERRKYGT